MSNPGLIRRAAYVLAAAAFFLLFVPRPAAADSTNIVTLSFSGCTTASCTTPETGTYQWNTATNSVGAWSFDTSLGNFSGDCTGLPASHCTEAASGQSYSGSFQLLNFSSGSLALQLAFSGASGFDGNILTSALTSSGNSTDPSMLAQFAANGSVSALLDIFSGASSVVPVATPEPSSLAMLGLGLLGLFIVRRRRSARRVRLAQS